MIRKPQSVSPREQESVCALWRLRHTEHAAIWNPSQGVPGRVSAAVWGDTTPNDKGTYVQNKAATQPFETQWVSPVRSTLNSLNI